jgi:pimeloyl-ACP methyl ester carboxylesterase
MSYQLTLPPALEPDIVDVQGTPVGVRRRGAGPPLMFLHGFGMAGRWLRFHEALAQSADVIAPDQIGCGDTPMQPWLRGFDDLALHYDDLRLALRVRAPFDLVGYSFGGWIAAEFAVTHPELVRSLTLVSPVGLSTPDGPALAVDPFAVTPQEMAAVLFNDFTNIAEVVPDVQSIDAVVRLYTEQTAYARLVWQRPYSRRLPRLLRRVGCPALVVTGGADRYVSPAVAARYHELLPDSRMSVLDGGGHALIVERPDAVAREIVDFLEETR